MNMFQKRQLWTAKVKNLELLEWVFSKRRTEKHFELKLLENGEQISIAWNLIIIQFYNWTGAIYSCNLRSIFLRRGTENVKNTECQLIIIPSWIPIEKDKVVYTSGQRFITITKASWAS
jgi:hypothetical protein